MCVAARQRAQRGWQHIKEGKHAIKWTRLSCMKFAANAVRLQLHALAYNLANFLRTLATPAGIEKWSLTSPRERLIKTGARLVKHARYAVFQFAEAALPREVFAGVLGLINGLRGPPGSCGAGMTVITATSNGRRRGDGRGVTGRWQYRRALRSGGQSTRLSPYMTPFQRAVRAHLSLLLPPMGLKLTDGNANADPGLRLASSPRTSTRQARCNPQGLV